MITTVSSAAALQTALGAAQSGDTILLAPGSYGAVNISGLRFDQDVTIASSDAASPAAFTSLVVEGSRGLSFADIEVRLSPSGGPFQVNSSQDVHFTGISAHGSLDGNSLNDLIGGLVIRRSDDVSVERSEFQQLASGVAHVDSSHVSIRASLFHGINEDGVRGGGSSFVTVADNTFRDFIHAPGVHPDAIQFWTTGTSASAHDIVISGNKYVRGGGEEVQGIFMRDELGNLPFENVTITNNLLAGASYHGISVLGGAGVTISGNIVAGFTDYKSWIMLQDVSGATISGNSANEYVTNTNVSGLTLSENVVRALAGDGGAAAIAEWDARNGAQPPTSPPTSGQTFTGSSGADTIKGGAGADTISDPGGSNYLRGGDGADRVTGGTDFDDINGNMGNDTASGGLGDDWAVGGKDDDLLGGDAGADLVYGNLGADTLDGGDGADIVRGGQDNDSLAGGAGADWMSGDRGSDTVNGGAGADIFHSFVAAGVDRVIDFRAAEGDRVQLDPGTPYTVAQVGADTVISMTGGAQMTLAGVAMASLPAGWLFVG